MSSTLSTVGPSSTAPVPSSTATSARPLSATSTLLFGFLVSSLSIFAIFMTSAIIWNRIVARRHMIDTMVTVNSNPPRESAQQPRRPTMWDVWTTPDRQSHPWLDVKPVAAQECDRPSSPSRTIQTGRSISFWRHHLLNWLPPEISYMFHGPTPQASSASSDAAPSQIEISDGSNIQISLLISMPYAPQSTQRNHMQRQRLHEIVFATTIAQYHDPGPS